MVVILLWRRRRALWWRCGLTLWRRRRCLTLWRRRFPLLRWRSRLTLRCRLRTFLRLRSRLPLWHLPLLRLGNRLTRHLSWRFGMLQLGWRSRALLRLRNRLTLLLVLGRRALLWLRSDLSLLLRNFLALRRLKSRTLLWFWCARPLRIFNSRLIRLPLLLWLLSRLTLLFGRGLVAHRHLRRSLDVAIGRQRLVDSHIGWAPMVGIVKLRAIGAGSLLVLELGSHRRGMLFMQRNQFNWRAPEFHPVRR